MASAPSPSHPASSLAPPQGGDAAPQIDDAPSVWNRVWVRLRWVSGDRIEFPWGPLCPVETLERFVQDLDEGILPGVPALRDRPQRGRYELLWGHRLLEEGPDHWLKDIGIVNDTELTLVFVPDAPPASPRG